MPEVISVDFKEKTVIAATTTPQRLSYINPHTSDPVVIGTNLPLDFFTTRMIESKSIADQGIQVFSAHAKGKEVISVNGKPTLNVTQSLIEAGAKYIALGGAF